MENAHGSGEPGECAIRGWGGDVGRQRVTRDCGQLKYLIAQAEADMHA
ncbi:hypothetical protein ABZS81_20615 [Streptomyces sp. NPDC005318]